MESLKEKLKNKQLPKQTKSKLLGFQQYALEVIREFDIRNREGISVDKNGKARHWTINYKAVIFKYACNSKPFLERAVGICREKFKDVKGKQNYLLSLLRKKKPWEEKNC